MKQWKAPNFWKNVYEILVQIKQFQREIQFIFKNKANWSIKLKRRLVGREECHNNNNNSKLILSSMVVYQRFVISNVSQKFNVNAFPKCTQLISILHFWKSFFAAKNEFFKKDYFFRWRCRWRWPSFRGSHSCLKPIPPKLPQLLTKLLPNFYEKYIWTLGRVLNAAGLHLIWALVSWFREDTRNQKVVSSNPVAVYWMDIFALVVVIL